MAPSRDAVSPAWDALRPASGWDALAAPATDALSATYVPPAADALAAGYGPDALAAPPSADALAAGYGTDALAAGNAATGDPLAAPILGDSLTSYGDATAAHPGTRPAPGRRVPRPGPVPPATAAGDDGSADDIARAAGRTERAGAGGQPRRSSPTPRPRRTAQPEMTGTRRTRSGGTPGTPGRSRSGSGAGGGYSGARSGGPAYGGSRTEAGAPYGGARTGVSGTRSAGAGGSRTGSGGSAAGGGRRAPADLGGIGAQGSRGVGRAPASAEWYGGPPHDVPAPRGQDPGWTPPPWANRTGRPTGTVPWAGGSGRAGWDDFFVGMGGTSGGSSRQPSGAEVVRALLDAFRRSRRNR